jgi:hypothetical protein
MWRIEPFTVARNRFPLGQAIARYLVSGEDIKRYQ